MAIDDAAWRLGNPPSPRGPGRGRSMASRATFAAIPATVPAAAARTPSMRDPGSTMSPSTSPWNAGAITSAASLAYSCPPGRDATIERTCPPALRSTARIAEVSSGDDMRRTLRHPPPGRPTRLAPVTSRALIALAAAPAAAAVLLAAGCGSTTAGGGAAQVTPAADRPAAVPVSVPRLGGPGDITIGRPGARPTVVNLWASWCGPCKEEMPAVQRFASANPGVRVVGIAIDDAPDAARDFAREVGVTFPLGVDSDDGVGDGYGVTGLPTTFLLDRQGRLASTWAGPVTEENLTTLVSSLGEGS